MDTNGNFEERVRIDWRLVLAYLTLGVIALIAI